MSLKDYIQANGDRLTRVGWFEGKSAEDVLNHLAEEVRELQAAHKNGRLQYTQNDKLEGIGPEAADVFNLICIYSYMEDLDLPQQIIDKNAYNETRDPE